MRIVDLSMTVKEHFRWKPVVAVTGDIAAGDQFRVTRLSTPCHGFSHVDAQAHFIAGGPTIEHTPLSTVVGRCRIFDLSDISPREEIGPERLAAADPGGEDDDIVLLSAQWDTRRDSGTREFWTDAPWLNRAAAEWLLTLRPRTLAVDFPQDYPIRLLLDGVQVPSEEHVTHDVLLRAGVTLVEYVANTAALSEKRPIFCAAPIKIADADGAPARVFAIEGVMS